MIYITSHIILIIAAIFDNTITQKQRATHIEFGFVITSCNRQTMSL